jgi:hypothetical protein
MEAESYHGIRSAQNVADSFTLSSGNMVCGPDSGDAWTSNIEANAPRLDYQVNFSSTGTFTFWVRAAGPNGSGDSVHGGMGGTVLMNRIDVNSANTLGWYSKTFTVGSTGVQTVNLWGREDGVFVDKIVINKSSTAPSGAGPAESPRDGGGTASCTDGAKNGTETDVDCGGSCGTKCANGKLCSVNSDCSSTNCVSGTCQAAASCSDGIKNGNETGVDCGGSCSACASCSDGVKNGNETGVDCGGSCAACASCGDSTCNGGETCSTCVGDCGSCSTGTGTISWEKWTGLGGTAIDTNALSTTPSSTGTFTLLEAPANGGDSYQMRVRGYLTAPTSGSYVFWMASDDNGELWLSTSQDPALKAKIAYHTGYTNSREWNKFTTQKSATINLTGGQRYYIEAIYKEGSGGDNMAVGWAKPGQSTTAPSEVIPGSQLSPWDGSSSPSCSDTVKNGSETDVDCGGSCSTKCANGKLCSVNSDCSSTNCVSGTCQAVTSCSDGVKNGNETGVDCGGSCSACASCSDGVKNGNETGVDCGGSCSACASCGDGIQNGNETGVDCGGSCTACGGSSCTEATATSLGGTGVETTVPANGCVKITQFPGWWNHRIRLETAGTAQGTPIPFSWSSSCSTPSTLTCTDANNVAVACSFTGTWQALTSASTTSKSCATVIDLQSASSGNVTLRWYNQ